MRHPSSRSERRHERERVIARRRFVYEVVWQMNQPPDVPVDSPLHRREHPLDWKFTEWGRYAKFNLGCGCRMCHAAKHWGWKDARRRALKDSWSRAEHRGKDKVFGR